MPVLGITSWILRKRKKTQEAVSGIQKLLSTETSGLETYLETVKPDLNQASYPGSPTIVERFQRDFDERWLFELHPQTFEELDNHVGDMSNAFVRNEDGLKALKALLPTPSRRALVLIDPSYEMKAEYDWVIDAMETVWKRMPNSVLAVWYPLVDALKVKRMETRIKQSSMRDVHLFEMSVDEPRNSGMTGSGMIVMNPPFTLPERFQQIFPNVSKALSVDLHARTRYELLQSE